MWKQVAEQIFHASGALHLVRQQRRGELRVLMYHRFPDNAAVRQELERQCRHILRYYSPVTLTEAAAALRRGDPLPANALVITIDDGYDDARIAGEIFRAHGLRATLYVVSGFLDRELWLWPDVVEFTCRNTRMASAKVPLPGYPPLPLRFTTDEERHASDAALDAAVLLLSDPARRKLIADLPSILDVALPPELPERYAPMSWQDLAGFRDVFEAGAHTRTHPVLSRIAEMDHLREEIQGSRARIEQCLDQPVRHFCYPNGTPDDYDERTMNLVRECGFETAVTTIDGSNPPGSNLYELRRTGAEPDHRPLYYDRRVAGMG